jgi:hypothetical protein
MSPAPSAHLKAYHEAAQAVLDQVEVICNCTDAETMLMAAEYTDILVDIMHEKLALCEAEAARSVVVN